MVTDEADAQTETGGIVPLRETLSRLQLRELLIEVQNRIEQIVEGRDRMDGLVEAMLMVTSGPELDQTLNKIVRTAVDLVDALYESAKTRQAWILATRDIGSELLAGTDPGRVFHLAADKSRQLSGAEVTVVVVPSDPEAAPDEVDELIVAATSGEGSAPMPDSIPVEGTSIGQVFVERKPARFDRFSITNGNTEAAGPALVLPLRAAEVVVGVLVALRPANAQPFTDDHFEMMGAFADQAALAWQSATAQHQMRELSILSDRDRIARDLHDHVIQRIFAVGLSLQGVIPRAGAPEVRQRLSDSVDDLQQVIQEIRTTIFDLHASSTGTARLRQRLDEAVAQFSSSDLRIRIHYTGPLSIVDPEVGDHAEAVVREAISNAVRHAKATTLDISVVVDDNLTIEVVDNGRGFSGDVTRSGLNNLQKRALDVGGDFTVQSTAGEGTALRWSAPCLGAE